MEISLSEQLFTFGFALILGTVLGIVFEVFRTVRSFFGGGTVAVFIQDIIFWITSAFITYSYFIVFTKGTVRIFVLIGAAIGFWLYIKSIGRAVSFLLRLFFKPIKFIFQSIFLIKKPKNFLKTLETDQSDDV